jgi:hypothetical protein
MARLSEQLKYFIAKKVSEDADWRGVEIVLSGHEVRWRYKEDPKHLLTSLHRFPEKESTRLWSTFASRRLNPTTMPTFGTVSTASTPTSSCSDY